MPHLILEYTDNVIDRPEPGGLLRELHDALVNCGPYSIEQIKSRVVIHDKFLCSDGEKDQAFVHLEVGILPREKKVMKETSEKMLAFLQEKFPKTCRDKNCCFTVDIRILEKEFFVKAVSGTL